MEGVTIFYIKVSNSCIKLNGVQNWIDSLLFNLNSASVYFILDNSESESGANLPCCGAEELRDTVIMALRHIHFIYNNKRF